MMIQFLKELYFTGFVVFSRWQVTGKPSAGTGIVILALMQWALLLAVICDIEMLLGQRILPHLPKFVILLIFFALYLVNMRILQTQGNGSEFEEEFGKMDKSRKTLLIVKLFVFVIAVVVFCIFSFTAHNHFLAIHGI